MKINNNYNLIDYLYHQKYYQRIGIDLPKRTDTSVLQEIIITRKLEKDDGVTMLFITEKQQKTILHFSLESLIVTE